MLYWIGKGSSMMLHLAYPAKLPFRCRMHRKFRDMMGATRLCGASRSN
jgi:hypothetical protein